MLRAQLAATHAEVIAWLQGLPGPVRAVYEAGPTRFGLARVAREAGIELMVCAPGAIPRQPGDHTKTNQRDALKLARLLAARQLRPVTVPCVELESLRHLVRAREDLHGDLMGARHRISKLLPCRGLSGPGARPRGSLGITLSGWAGSIWGIRSPARVRRVPRLP